MVIGLDSATPPTAAQAQAAKAGGIGVWSGYLATKPGVKLYRPWALAEFNVAKQVGGIPIAYASGIDDPAACKALAGVWGVRLCLDVEGGIRGDGPWVQGWLDASGAGLYGTSGVHGGRRAAFHIAAWYIGSDPHATWPASWARPTTPCGWQWQNTHNEFGVGVDRCWLDDWFGGKKTMTAEDIVGVWYWILMGRPAAAAEIANWASNLKQHPDQAAGMFMQLAGTPEAKAHLAKLVGAPASGPAIPPGTTFTATTK